MAKVKSPLLSIGAQGSVGKSVVFASWRGVPYVRQHVNPSNPNTQAQQAVRGTFAQLDEQYKRLGPLAREPWTAEAKRRPLTDRNAFMRANMPVLRGEADMSAFIGSMGAAGGLPPTSVLAETGAAEGEIDVTIGTSKAPAGWTLTAVVAVAIHDRDPSAPPTTFAVEGSVENPDLESEATVTLTGAVTGEDYVVSAWTVWQKANGDTAYGASLTAPIVAAG